jgi:hypothetical protein
LNGPLAVRRHVAPIRLGLRAEIEAAVPLEPGERVLLDWRIVRGGDWLPRLGYLRVTDRRVLVLVGHWLARNDVIELPSSGVHVRPAPVFDPVIRLEVDAPVDDELLAFRAWDWFPPAIGRGIALGIRQQSIRTTQLRELLLLVLGSSDRAVEPR